MTAGLWPPAELMHTDGGGSGARVGFVVRVVCRLLLCTVGSGLLTAGTVECPAAGAASSTTVEPLVLHSPGPGYAVVSQGPLDPSHFVAGMPDAPAVAALLTSVVPSTRTYGRTWQSGSGRDEVTDEVLRFASATEAEGFDQDLVRTLASADIVSAGALPSATATHEVTYLLGSNPGPPGVGEVVTTRAGVYVAVLSFVSRADLNPRPITLSASARVVSAERAALVSSHRGTDTAPSTRGPSGAAIGWAIAAVAVLAVAVATPLVLRRRRQTKRSV